MTRPVVFVGGPVDGTTIEMPTPLPVTCAIPDPTPQKPAVYRLSTVEYGEERYPVYRAYDEPHRVIERLINVHLGLIRGLAS